MRPQTIQIFLPTGDPRGTRVAEITTRIVRVIEVPRSQLADFNKMPEAEQVGVYFLMGELSESGLPRTYIGQSGNVGRRLEQHHQKKDKDFWNRAFVVISLTNSMTQTHALFLEWFAISEATKAGRYSLENGNNGSQPYTPAPLQADCHEIHETAATLLATLGQPIFEPLTQNTRTIDGKPVEWFYCKGKEADAKGEYTTEGFVVHKNSTARLENVASIKGTSQERFRQQLLTDGVLKPQGNQYIFTRDHLFSSPSMAAIAVLGRSANGWMEWKTVDGQTLDGAKRQAVEADL
jgi:predicted GIY-YIG superfamily endonuclease